MYRFSNTLETYPKVWCSWRNIPNDWKGYAFYFHPQQPTMDSQSEGRVGFLQDFSQIFALAFQNTIFCQREVPKTSTYFMLFTQPNLKWCNVNFLSNIFHLLEPSLTQKSRRGKLNCQWFQCFQWSPLQTFPLPWKCLWFK